MASPCTQKPPLLISVSKFFYSVGTKAFPRLFPSPITFAYHTKQLNSTQPTLTIQGSPIFKQARGDDVHPHLSLCKSHVLLPLHQQKRIPSSPVLYFLALSQETLEGRVEGKDMLKKFFSMVFSMLCFS